MTLSDPITSQKLFVELRPPKAYKSLEDRQLWNAFRAGDEHAFVAIYEHNFDCLYAYGIRIAGDECLVEDAIQEVFIDLKRQRLRIKETDSIKFYLFKCLKRKLHREANKWSNRREELDCQTGFGFLLSHEQLLIDRQMDEEAINRLNKAIEKLSPRKKELIYYFFYEGLSYGQIQDLMGLENIKSARNLLYKALNFLRETL